MKRLIWYEIYIGIFKIGIFKNIQNFRNYHNNDYPIFAFFLLILRTFRNQKAIGAITLTFLLEQHEQQMHTIGHTVGKITRIKPYNTDFKLKMKENMVK